jgi:type II restriction enzyme
MATSEKKNRGEWSELFVLVNLLASGELHYMNRDSTHTNSAFPVVLISRRVSGFEHRFRISHGYVEILGVPNEKVVSRVSQEILQELSLVLLDEIKKGKGRAFTVPSAAKIMSALRIEKATGIQGKDDLRITIYDPRTKQQNSQGFSIKSFLGSNPSILNASGVTNIEFIIEGNLSDNQKQALNNLGPIALVSNLVSTGHELVLSKIDQRFAENLEMIDSEMVSLLGQIVIASYEGDGRSMPDIVRKLTLKNPLNYSPRNSESRYTHKIKDLLEAVALGMRPSEPWSGNMEAEGGNLIVTSNGEILCHHALDKDSLRNYLFSNTYIDTPSRSKWKFGSITRDKLTLNFQIRVKN